MATDDLREALLAVPGVAAAHVAEGDQATPIVRVWLDGTRAEAAVSIEINDVITRRGFRGVPSEVPAEQARSEPALSHPPAEIARVAVEETQRGLAIRVSGAGGDSVEPIRQGALATEEAILTAVARLLDVTPPTLVSIEDRPVDGSVVVVAVVEGEHGRRTAGAAVVAGGRPFAIARAIRSALRDLF